MISRLSHSWRTPWVRLVARLAFATAVMFLLLARVDLQGVLSILGLVRPTSLLPPLAIYLLVRFVQACRTSIGLRLLGIRLGMSYLYEVKLISSFYSLVLPGELIGSGIAWRKLAKPTRRAIEVGALLLYSRLLDVLLMMAFGLAGLYFNALVVSAGFQVVAAAMCVGVLVLLMPFVSPSLVDLIGRITTRLLSPTSLPVWLRSKATAACNAVLALQMLSNTRASGAVFGLSLTTIALAAVNLNLMAHTVGIHLPFAEWVWIHSVVGLLQIVPVSVAGLGVREASLVLILRSYGIPEAQALSFSLVIFAVAVVGGTVGGLLEARDLWSSGRRSGRSVWDEEAETGAVQGPT